MNYNKIWIAATALMIGIMWAMLCVHHDYIIKQGKQIKQLEDALSVYGKIK